MHIYEGTMGFIESGKIVIENNGKAVSDISWNPHPSFKGVSLKLILDGKSLSDRMSCHFVRIDPDCEIGMHEHGSQLEIHEVISGNGTCIINEKETAYSPGTIAVIPEKTPHCVKAGKKGLVMFAKFSPPLM